MRPLDRALEHAQRRIVDRERHRKRMPVFTAMRKVYGQGISRTLVKLTILTFAYISGFAVMMAITGIYSVWSI